MNDVAWENSARNNNSGGSQALSNSSGVRQGYNRMAQPQRTRDDAQVGYFYQRPSNTMNESGGQFKQRWAVGDDSVLDQVRSAGDVNRMTNEFHALDLDRDSRPRNMDEKLWDAQENNKNEDIFNQWPAPNAWVGGTGITGSNHSVSQPIMVQQRRQLSPSTGTFQGQENAVMSPRSDTSGLGLSMAEYVLASSPQGKDIEGKHHRLKPGFINQVPDGSGGQHQPGGDSSQQPQPNNGKKSKTPSPFEAEGDKQEVVENGIDPVPQQKPDEDPNAFSRTPGSRNASPTEQEESKNAAMQQPATSTADMQRQNMIPKVHQQHHPQHPQHQQPSEGAYIEGGVQNPLQIDTGAGMENVGGMEGLQFDYSAGNQMAHSMDSPSYINYDQSQVNNMLCQYLMFEYVISVDYL
nr:pumilio homolog 2-like [Lytechinus pictus]